MKLNLRSLVLASAITETAALASFPALAATTGATLLYVPFSFTVSGDTLPAGNYLVKRDTGNFISLAAADGSSNYSWISSVGEKGDGKVVLHFAIDGQNHILDSVQYGTLASPHLVRHSRKTEDITPQYKVGR